MKAEGFQASRQDVDVRSAVPVQMKFSLLLGEANTSVTVGAGEDLVETAPDTHTDLDRKLFEKLPLESQSSSLSSLVTLASPGVAADSNGLFHGLGDHASNSFSVDGQPITDQQSKVFSNQLPVNSVQSMEVIEGAPPAEYGDKTSLVIVVNTRSGLDTPKAARQRLRVLRQFRHGDGRLRPGVREKAVGKLRSPWTAWTPAAFWTGRNSASCTTAATRGTFSTGSITSPRRTTLSA